MLQALKKRFKWIVIAYVFFIVLWLVAWIFQAGLTKFIDTSAGLNMGDGFVLSWRASLFEDIIFFGVIGILGLYLSTKLPHDEKFNIRIESIANGKKVGDKARKFLHHRIKRMLVYNDSHLIRIVIKSVDATNKLVEIYAEHSAVCTNMCKDVAYPLDTRAYVKPTHQCNGDYGYVSLLEICEEGNPKNKETLVRGNIHKLTSQGFSKPILFDVPPNGAAFWHFCYSIWQQADGNKSTEDDWYYVENLGFTESLNIELINQTDQDLYFDFQYKDRNIYDGQLIERKREVLKAKGQDDTRVLLLNNMQAHSRDSYKLFMYTK